MNGDSSSASSPIATIAAAAAGPEPGGRPRGGAVINPGRRELWEPDTEHFPSLADRARASTRHVIKNGLASPTHSAHATFFRPQTNSTITKVSPDRRAKKVNNRRCHVYISRRVVRNKTPTAANGVISSIRLYSQVGCE